VFILGPETFGLYSFSRIGMNYYYTPKHAFFYVIGRNYF
jgi:hypothetical protein